MHLLLLQSDGLQELGEFWLGHIALWFRKTGQRESILPLPMCFYFVFLFFPFLFLLLSRSTKLWSGMACLPNFDLVFLYSLLGVCVDGVSKTVGKRCQVLSSDIVWIAGSGRERLSDSNRKAFIYSTCHDPGTITV